MKRKILAVFVIVACVLVIAGRSFNGMMRAGFASSQNQRAISDKTIQIGGQTVHVFVADTPALRQKGLGGRAGLASDEGMLFVFPREGAYAFWMKGMRFSIDILWLSTDGTLVDMRENVSPDTYPKNFTPKSPARYVVELRAGFVQEHSVRMGDIVRL